MNYFACVVYFAGVYFSVSKDTALVRVWFSWFVVFRWSKYSPMWFCLFLGLAPICMIGLRAYIILALFVWRNVVASFHAWKSFLSFIFNSGELFVVLVYHVLYFVAFCLQVHVALFFFRCGVFISRPFPYLDGVVFADNRIYCD